MSAGMYICMCVCLHTYAHVYVLWKYPSEPRTFTLQVGRCLHLWSRFAFHFPGQCIHIHILMHTHTHMHIHLSTHRQTYVYTQTCAFTWLGIQLYIYTCIYIYMFTYLYMYMYMYIDIYMHLNIHIYMLCMACFCHFRVIWGSSRRHSWGILGHHNVIPLGHLEHRFGVVLESSWWSPGRIRKASL